jgi:ADP-ribose pyrophosphatase YjhB (NUDIX family)
MPPVFKRNSHCSFCGQPFPAGAGWPRTCARCGQISYRNPVPVTVVLIPVEAEPPGVLVVRRAIEPGRGRWALPGGFVNVGETWQAAGVREVLEETGLVLDPAELRVYAVHSTPRPADNVLIFALARPRAAADLPPFTPNEEVSELAVLQTPQELAFSLHTQVLESYLTLRST